MITTLPYETDGGAGATGRFGLIVLSTDETIEAEARYVLHRPGFAVFHARIPAHALVTPATLKLMEAEMPQTAAQLPLGLDAIGYACTSGATVIGPERVESLVQSVHPGTPVTNPMTSVVRALYHLKARRIALVTPYLPSVSASLRDLLAGAGIDTVVEFSFNQEEDKTVALIAEASTLAALRMAGRAEVDAIFTSCTNLRTFGILEQAERETGMPVVSSNQALLWNMLVSAGHATSGMGPGRLFSE